MSMELQIQQDIKAAMLAKEKTRLESLRAIKAAILLAKTADGSESISDEAVVKIIQKLVKQRKETAEIYKQQNREELAANELAEAAAMEVYLPKQLSEAEIEEELKKIIAQVGATGYGQSYGYRYQSPCRQSRGKNHLCTCKENASVA